MNLPAHFYMAPSASSRWLNCPGSLTYAPQFPDEAGEAAEIGTLGHAMVEAELKGETLDSAQLDFLGTLSQGQREWLQDAVELCVEIISELEGDILLEEKIQHEFLTGEHGGTIDVILYNDEVIDSPVLHVIDFKFGQVPVEIFGNTQIKCYLNLARQRFQDAREFYGSILQPSISDKLQTVRFSMDELEAHEVAVVEASISEEFKAGDHCQWCPALIACETAARYLHAQVQDFPDLSKLDKTQEPTAQMLLDVARAYKVAKMAEKATEGAGDLIKGWAALGVNVKAHGLTVSNTQRQVWADGAKEWLVGKGVDPAILVKESLVTPGQLRKALGLTKAQFSEKYPGAIKTVPSPRLTVGKAKEGLEFDEL